MPTNGRHLPRASMGGRTATARRFPCTRRRVTLHYICNTMGGGDMSEATFTFRVDEVLKAEFSSAAKARDRSAAQLLRDFMREFVQQQQEAADHDAWFH